ncbi:MAG: DUF5522 domain-containing protein [Ilumatobacter sp.]|uniref:DUF5522 domain-containing protein n=1 Tax=Ilumatobacter sp. TaxID=1967498 RepID=UPI003C780D0D
MDVPSEPSPPLRDRWLDSPHVSRLSSANQRFDEIMERHRSAVETNLPTYADPVSGFSVFTAVFLAKRGYCCDSGCRHCPFRL